MSTSGVRRRQVFLLLTALYFAQGLPFGFFVQALPVVLRTRGYDLETIGLTALLALPWALKFLWAPLVDGWGTRRGWILAMQASMTALLLSLAALGGGEPSLLVIMAGVFATNLLAATQDVATDGLAVRLLPPADRGLANGVQVAAYRLGMILGGGALLALFGALGWSGAFGVMAGLVALTAGPVARWGREPVGEGISASGAPAGDRAPGRRLELGPRATPARARTKVGTSSGRQGALCAAGTQPRLGARGKTVRGGARLGGPSVRPRDAALPTPERGALRAFFSRPGAVRLLTGLLVFKAGEAAATAMLRPWLVDRGLDLEAIGALLGGVGFTAGLVGALLGGWAAGRFERRRTLYAFAVLQAAVVASYGVLALGAPGVLALCVVVGLEHLVAGLATAALFTTMMDRCRAGTASTDYTVQASAVVIATGAASALAGFGAAELGYAGHFFGCAALAAAAIAVVPWLVPRSFANQPAKQGERTMRRALYAGSFDPVTVGHLAVIDAAARVFDEVVVLIADNPAKTTLFDREERLAQLSESLGAREGVRVDATDGLVAAYARAHGIQALVRGLRGGAEADYELDLARANRTVAPELETVLLPAPPEVDAVSSSLLKQMAAAGLDGARLCPPGVWAALQDRLSPVREAS